MERTHVARMTARHGDRMAGRNDGTRTLGQPGTPTARHPGMPAPGPSDSRSGLHDGRTECTHAAIPDGRRVHWRPGCRTQRLSIYLARARSGGRPVRGAGRRETQRAVWNERRKARGLTRWQGIGKPGETYAKRLPRMSGWTSSGMPRRQFDAQAEKPPGRPARWQDCGTPDRLDVGRPHQREGTLCSRLER